MCTLDTGERPNAKPLSAVALEHPVSHAGAAALYLAEKPDALPREVAATLTTAATMNKIQSSRFKPGTPNRLLYSRFGSGDVVQAAQGP